MQSSNFCPSQAKVYPWIVEMLRHCNGVKCTLNVSYWVNIVLLPHSPAESFVALQITFFRSVFYQNTTLHVHILLAYARYFHWRYFCKIPVFSNTPFLGNMSPVSCSARFCSLSNTDLWVLYVGHIARMTHTTLCSTLCKDLSSPFSLPICLSLSQILS